MSINVNSEELKTLQKSFSDSWKDLKGLLDTQADQLKTYGETNESTADKIKSVEDKLVDYDKEMKGITEKFTAFETQMNRKDFTGGSKTIKSPGELFVESEAYKSMVQKGSRNSEPVEIKSFYNMETKDLDSTDINGGLLVQGLRVPEIIADRNRELRLRDVLNVQRTTSNSISFIEETGFINASAPVAEKIAKPESDIDFAQKESSIKTIAHFIPSTRQILADATQLQGYIENRLIYGLQMTEESQVLYGDGVGENLQGIMTNTLIQDHGYLPTGETMIDHIRRAMTKSIVAGYPVTSIVLHPADFATIQLAKGSDGHYIWIDVTTGGVPRLWAVPVVQSLAMSEGEFLLGAFGLGATIYDREQANVRVSEQHGDYFIRNMVAILAEERLGLVTFRPESFVRGSFDEAPATTA